MPVGDGQPTLRVKSLTVGGTRGMSAERAAGGRRSGRRPGRAPASRSRRSSRAAARPRSGCTRARSSTSCRRRAKASASGSSATAAPGFAYAGTLDDVGDRRGARRGARQRRSSAPSTSGRRWPSPTVSRCTEQPLWNDALADFPTDRKIELAKELEQLASGADPRVRVDDANYADAHGGGGRGLHHRHPDVGSGERLLRVGRRRWPTRRGRRRRDPDRLRVLGRARSPDEFDLDRAAREAVDRATRLLGATQAVEPSAHRRARPVRHRTVPRGHLLHAQRRGRGQGALACSRDRSASRWPPVGHPGRRPDEPAGLHRHRRRRRGPRRPSQRAHPGRCAAAVRAQLLHGSSGGDRLHRQRRARWLRGHARRGLPGPVAACPARATSRS